jgi:NAD(P)-dependent dehydrogenase (short-subunit alcohol dehydrogenase family)
MSAIFPELAGRHVLVSGGAQGIGKAIVGGFAAANARVTVLDRSEAVHESLPPNAFAVICDLTDPYATVQAVAQAIDARGSVTILVNNAGSDRRIPIDDLDPDLFREMLAINLDHHLHLARLVAPGMRIAGGGAIVNLSSTAFMKIAGDLAAYHAAKAGIIGLTRGLARDLGGANIRVNAIAPGRVFTQRALDQVDEEWIAETRAIQCLPLLIQPEDIAATALWLSSDSARAVTAQTIIIDGGVV